MVFYEIVYDIYQNFFVNNNFRNMHLSIIYLTKAYWIKIKKNEDMLAWEWDFLEVSSTSGRGKREFVSR